MHDRTDFHVMGGVSILKQPTSYLARLRWRTFFLLLFAAGVILPGHAQTLTNGFDHAGNLILGTTNSYTLYATNGDTVALRVGAPTFRPLLTVHAPNGTLVGAGAGSGSSANDAPVSITAATNGLFTVRVSSYYGNGSGAYSLSVARVPSAFEVSPGDEGGVIANGQAGDAILSLGDLDMWSFTAETGDSLMVRVGANGFRPYVLLYGPTGTQLALGAGGGSGDTDGLASAIAPTNGTYTAVVQAYYADGTGPYTIHMAKSTGSFVVSPGDEGGDLINGADTPGEITKGDLDLWRFEATEGENIVIRMGSPGFRPWVRVYGPTGKLFRESVAGGSSQNDAWVSGMVTNTGTFLVLVQSYYPSLSSAYTLSLVKAPGPYIVSPGDDGGVLTNGVAHQGTNSLGDLDAWTFSANAGQNIALRVGAPDYRPWLQLYSPNGTLIQEALGSSSAHRDAAMLIQVTNSGVFTVVQQSVYADGIGPYTLSFGQFPGSHFVSTGDEGGRLTNAVNYDASIALGDLDLWNFAACKGYPFTLVCQKLSGSSFTPRVRLYARNGVLLATSQNASTVTIAYPGTNSGSYTVMVDGAAHNDVGTYRLTAYGIYEEGSLDLCPPIVMGNNVNLTGFGGTVANSFVLLMATDLTIPITSWTPFWTNQFDGFGSFDHTNIFTGGESTRFFMLRTP
jgi:hypothetical protein